MLQISLQRQLVFCLCLFNLMSCQSKDTKRVYEEIILNSDQPALSVDQSQSPRLDNVNAVDPRVLLKEMVERGEDPHAFLNQSDAAPDPSAPARALNSDNQQMLMKSLGDAKLEWKTPANWDEKPQSGMRLASFKVPESTDLDISIVSLSGEAGGLASNINRWLNQVGAAPLSESEFEQFMSRQKKIRTDAGSEAQLIDLAQQKPQRQSTILAATMNLDNETLFIKMTGSPSSIEKNRTSFMAMVRSIKPRS